jgi:hypothetical protein
MSNPKLEKFRIEQMSFDNNEDGNIKIQVEGYTKMPFWKHDLKLKAIIALLETVDMKDYAEDGNIEELEQELNKIEDLIKAIKGI